MPFSCAHSQSALISLCWDTGSCCPLGPLIGSLSISDGHPVAGVGIALVYPCDGGAGILPHLSEQRTSSNTLLGSRLTFVSHCFSISFMIHDLGYIFSLYLFGSEKWAEWKCCLETNGTKRRNWYHA